MPQTIQAPPKQRNIATGGPAVERRNGIVSDDGRQRFGDFAAERTAIMLAALYREQALIVASPALTMSCGFSTF